MSTQKIMKVYASTIILFLFFPVLIVLPLSFSADRFLNFPPSGYSLRWYQSYFNDPTWLDATLRSLRVGFAASALSTLTGTMLAIWTTRTKGIMARLFRGISVAPAILPNVLIALGFFIVCVFSGLTDNELVLIAAHATLGLPFVVLIIGAALADADPTLERAARIFGAGPIRAFVTGTLPAVTPAIASAALFAFFISFDELIIALFTMGGNLTLPVRMWTELQFEIDPTISAVSILLVLLTTAGMGLAEFLRRRAGRRRKTID